MNMVMAGLTRPLPIYHKYALIRAMAKNLKCFEEEVTISDGTSLRRLDAARIHLADDGISLSVSVSMDLVAHSDSPGWPTDPMNLYTSSSASLTSSMSSGSFLSDLKSYVAEEMTNVGLTPSGLDSLGVLSYTILSPTYPTMSPTPAPTAPPAYPKLSGVSVNTVSKSSLMAMVKISTDQYNYAGTVWCNAFLQMKNSTTGGMVKSGGFSSKYKSPTQSPIQVLITGLSALTKYYVYCYAETIYEDITPDWLVASFYPNQRTACCKDIYFTNAPSFVYGDILNKYPPSTDPSMYTFTFTLSVAPSANINVFPIIKAVSTSTNYSVQVVPSKFTFTSASSVKFLTGSFILTTSQFTSGSYVLSFATTGSSTSEYYTSTSTLALPTAKAYFQIVSSIDPLPAPSIVSIRFSDTGAYFLVIYSGATDQAGYILPSDYFPCSKLLTFVGASQVTCSWLNATYLRGTFSTYTTSASLVPGGRVYVKPNVIRSQCTFSDTTGCSLNYLNIAQNVTALTALNPVVPKPVLIIPALFSSCDDILLDASQSNSASGSNGGRPWSNAQFVISSANADFNSTGVNWYVSKYGSTSSAFSIPRNYFSQGDYDAYLTLTNFLGATTQSSVVSFTIAGNPNIPSVSIVGSGSMSLFTPTQSISITAAASFSSCATAAKSLGYSWDLLDSSGFSVFDNDGRRLASTTSSVDPKILTLTPHSLLPGYTYYAQVTVTSYSAASGGIALGTSSAISGFFVQHGKVVAVVTGGVTRTNPEDQPFILDARLSYDEDLDPMADQNLKYVWTCTIGSSIGYGSNCGVFGSDNSTVTIEEPFYSIPAGRCASGTNYLFKLVVTSLTDGRQDSTTISYSPSVSGSVYVSVTSLAKKFNIDSTLLLSGYMKAKVGVTASWSIFCTGNPIKVSTNLTQITQSFTSAQAMARISFPLAIAPYSFIGGATYTFRLFAQPPNLPQFASYSEVSLTVNMPPINGYVTVSPTTGNALETVFSISSIGWVDDSTDYPLQFLFSSQAAPTAPALTIAAPSTKPYSSSTLPPGVLSQGYYIKVIGAASDIYSASANTSVNVFSKLSPKTDVGAVLTSALSTSLASSNHDATFATVNNVASALNIVNCTAAPNCALLHRSGCLKKPNTCGPCLNGFTGVVGDSNKKCFNSSSTDGKNGYPCTSNDDCIYGYCWQNTCEDPPLHCVTGVPGVDCSGNGICTYYDNTGLPLPYCSIKDVFCKAKCECDPGFGGSDCSLDSEQLLARDASRNTMCLALITTYQQSNPSSQLLDTLVGSLLGSFSPDECITANTKMNCATALGELTYMANQGYLKGAKPSTAQFVTQTASAFVVAAPPPPPARQKGGNSKKKGPFLTTEYRRALAAQAASADAAVASLAKGVGSTLVGGQAPVPLVTDNIRMSVNNALGSSLQNKSLAPPQTDAEAAYGSISPNIALPPSGLNSCPGMHKGYAALSMMQWGTNPYGGSQGGATVGSPLIKFGSSLPPSNKKAGARRLLDEYDQSLGGRVMDSYEYDMEIERQLDEEQGRNLISEKETMRYHYYRDRAHRDELVPIYYISLQYSQKKNLNFTALRYAEKGGKKANVTLPFCTLYDSSVGRYVPCNHCNVSSYTEYNVTFGCYDITQLCPKVNGKKARRLDILKDRASTHYFNSIMASRDLQADDGAAGDDDGGTNEGSTSGSTIGALLAAILAVLAAVLSSNPFAIDLSKAKPILAFISTLIFVILGGEYFFIKWDTAELKHAVYLKASLKDKKRRKNAEEIMSGGGADKKEDDDSEKRKRFDLETAFQTRPSPIRRFFSRFLPSRSNSDTVTETQSSETLLEAEVISKLPDEEEELKGVQIKIDRSNIPVIGALVAEFLEAVMPTETLLEEKPTILTFIDAIIENHDLWGAWKKSSPAISGTRAMRWLELWRGILISLFIDSIFFMIFFPDDGTCSLFPTHKTCIMLQSSTTGKPTCLWVANSDDGGGGANEGYTGNYTIPSNATNSNVTQSRYLWTQEWETNIDYTNEMDTSSYDASPFSYDWVRYLASNDSMSAMSSGGGGTDDMALDFNGQCQLRPPPGTLSFTMIIALLCLIIAIPVDTIIGYVMETYCSKRPNFEWFGCGCESDAWLGTPLNRPSQIPLEGDEAKEEKGVLAELLTSIAEGTAGPAPGEDEDYGKGDMNKSKDPQDANNGFAGTLSWLNPMGLLGLNTAAKTDDADVNTVKQKKFQYKKDFESGENDDQIPVNDYLAQKVLDDYTSPEEEVRLIMKNVKDFLMNDVESPYKAETSGQAQERLAKMKAIMEVYGVYPDGTPAPMSLYNLIRYRTLKNKLRALIVSVRNKANIIKDELSSYGPEEAQLKDYCLVQNFILEQMTYFKRRTLEKKFFAYDGVAPEEPINPVVWILAWMFGFGAHGLFVYWMFSWGVKNGGNTMESWGINFVIAFVQDCFGIQPIKIFLFEVLALRGLKPQLRNIYRTLNHVAMTFVQTYDPNEAVSKSNVNVVQSTSATCRVARSDVAKELASAVILRNLDDFQVAKCRVARGSPLGLIMFWIIVVPIVIALVNEFLADTIVDTAIPTVISYLTVGFDTLFTLGGTNILIIPFVCMFFLWMVKHINLAAIARIRKKKELETALESCPHWYKTKRVRNKLSYWSWLSLATTKLLDSFSYPLWYMYEGAAVVQKQESERWQNMNKANDLQGFVPPASVSKSLVADLQGRSKENSKSLRVLATIPEQIKRLHSGGLDMWTFKPDPILKFFNNILFGAQDNRHLGKFHVKADGDAHVIFQAAPALSSNRVKNFRTSQITTDAKIALGRILDVYYESVGLRTSDGENDNQGRYVQNLIWDQNHFDPLFYVAEYVEILSRIWTFYYPGGVEMNQSEKEEILDRFMLWMRSINAAGGFVASQGASYSQFKLWFLRISSDIERMRIKYPLHPGGFEMAKLHHKGNLEGDKNLIYNPQHRKDEMEVEFDKDFALDGGSSSSGFVGDPNISPEISDSDSNDGSDSMSQSGTLNEKEEGHSVAFTSS